MFETANKGLCNSDDVLALRKLRKPNCNALRAILLVVFPHDHDL